MNPNGDPERKLQLTLHADAVATPAHSAARMCREVIDLYFDTLAKADLSQPPPAPQDTFFRFSITGPDISADERRSKHENWILAKVFQDLMRGVRGSLEKAYLFVQLLSVGNMRAETDTTVDELLAPFRKKAQDMSFPDLLGKLNQEFATPLAFSREYASMQTARNCLEHREGIVGKRDIDETGVFSMSFPRIKFFVVQDGMEVDIYKNFRTTEEMSLQIRLETRQLAFRLGEHFKIGIADFDDIAFGCAEFGTSLAQQVAKIGSVPPA